VPPPTCAPGKAGSTWPPSSTPTPAGYSAGPSPNTCAPIWSNRRCRWRSPCAASSPPRSCSTPTEAPQYASAQITRFAIANSITRSMGRTGVCWGNAIAESFFATVKTEFYYQRVWPTQARAQLQVGAWIEDRYNRRRRHSALGQISPVQVRTATLQPPRGKPSSRIAQCPPDGVRATRRRVRRRPGYSSQNDLRRPPPTTSGSDTRLSRKRTHSSRLLYFDWRLHGRGQAAC